MGNSCSPGCRWWCLRWRLFVLSFFPLHILDEIWDVIESVSEGFLTYYKSFTLLLIFIADNFVWYRLDFLHM